jgi:hypothetical protein
MNSQNHITRRKTRQIMVGNVAVGGDAPISVQSMTNTETCDVDATLKQIQRLVTAGVDIVRVSVPSMDAAAAFKEIRSKVKCASCRGHTFRSSDRAPSVGVRRRLPAHKPWQYWQRETDSCSSR